MRYTMRKIFPHEYYICKITQRYLQCANILTTSLQKNNTGSTEFFVGKDNLYNIKDIWGYIVLCR